jgi:hypothetical protein
MDSMTRISQPSDTPKKSLREIAATMRKSREPYWISKYLFRPWTVYLSALLAKRGLSPNAITAISGICVAAGALLLAMSSAVGWFLGGVLVLLYFTLDHCDGEVARYNAVVLNRASGPVGIFWDGIAHGLGPLLVVAIGYRLLMEGSLGVWPMVFVAIGLTAGATSPWQRSCEAVLAWANQHWRDNGTIRIPSSFMDGGGDEPESSDAGLSLYQAIKQSILFPGTFITLPIAAFLDSTVGPISIPTGEANPQYNLYWVAFWLLQIAVGNTAAAINASVRNARTLRRIHTESIGPSRPG